MVFNPKLDWKNEPDKTTPITAADLIRIETGIADGDLTNQGSAASTRAGQIFEPIGLSDTTKTYVSDTIVAEAATAIVDPSNALGEAAATVIGVKGDTGPQGLPGVNAVDNDTAVAGYISTTGTSATKTALNDRLPYLNIRAFGGKGDRADYLDATMTSGATSLTSSAASFSSADVGKLVAVDGAGASGGTLAASIVSVESGVATLSAAASVSVAGVMLSVGTNNNTPIASMIAAVPASGATLFFPRGGYMYSSQIAPPNNTVWRGEGAGITVLTPVSSTHGFYRMGNTVAPYGPTPTPDDPPTGIMWIDLTVDGARATGQMKGWYLNHLKKCRWVRTSCINTGASGYGVDYLQDCSFINAYVENAGRAGTISSAGFSGFGIGTGAFERENVYFVDCVATGCKRFGLFLENQDTSTQSTGAQIIGGRYEGNQWGISDNGSDQLIVSGAHIVNNVADGFILTTTAAIEQVGNWGTLQDCTIHGNGGDGVQFDYTQNDLITYGNYTVQGCNIYGNTGFGIRTRAAVGRAIPGLSFTKNRIHGNGAAGVGAFGGVLTNCGVSFNEIFDNGSAGTYTRGIMLAGDLTDSEIGFNRIFDTRASGSKTQQHGIWISTTAPASAITGGRIIGNDLRGNGTGSIAGAGQISSTTRVRDNDGYNPIGADALTVGASPYTYTAGGTDETLYIIGGTFSTIKINTVTVYNSGAVTGTLVLPVDAGALVEFTYSVVPTAIKRVRH